jgi:hypothetical protein
MVDSKGVILGKKEPSKQLFYRREIKNIKKSQKNVTL